MSGEALQKLLMEMDNQLNKSKAELSMCSLQLNRVNTNLNMITQTNKALSSVCDTKANETVWKGIGKAFIKTDVNDYLEEISKDKTEFMDSKKSLETKKHYLETTLEKTIDNMTRIVGKPQA